MFVSGELGLTLSLGNGEFIKPHFKIAEINADGDVDDQIKIAGEICSKITLELKKQIENEIAQYGDKNE